MRESVYLSLVDIEWMCCLVILILFLIHHSSVL